MKKLRLFVVAGALALAFISPTESFAYKYYIHLKSGQVLMIEAQNKKMAEFAFDSMCANASWMEDAYLTSRPNGGFMKCESVDDAL